MNELGGRRSGYRNPEVVLAEARRRAERIRRDAERDAAAIRREAATWASRTRAEADDYRDRILEDLASKRELPPANTPGSRAAVAGALAPPPPPPPPPPPVPASRWRAAVEQDDVLVGDVIDLRAAANARRSADIAAGIARGDYETLEVSLETKLYDVVILALRRTFDERATS